MDNSKLVDNYFRHVYIPYSGLIEQIKADAAVCERMATEIAELRKSTVEMVMKEAADIAAVRPYSSKDVLAKLLYDERRKQAE